MKRNKMTTRRKVIRGIIKDSLDPCFLGKIKKKKSKMKFRLNPTNPLKNGKM